MSLELAIQNNTAAIERLIAVLTETVPQPVTVNLDTGMVSKGDQVEQLAENSSANAAEPAAKETKKRAKKEAAPAALGEPAQEVSAPALEPGASDAPATEAAAIATKPPTYADAAAAVTSVIKTKGTPAAKDLLKAFGAETLKGVKPEQFGAVISACEAVLV